MYCYIVVEAYDLSMSLLHILTGLSNKAYDLSTAELPKSVLKLLWTLRSVPFYL